jgi:hypothetical protein
VKFSSKSQQKVYARTQQWMRVMFGEGARAHPTLPMFFVREGSTIAQIAVHPWGDNDSVITARAYVVQDAAITADLLLYLLRHNDMFRFGAFGVDENNDIFFQHSIVGSTCDREELEACVLAVAHTADRFDDEIKSRWGGKSAVDKIMEG